MTQVREPAPGEILGHNYMLEKELGRGGFGVVYRARHVDIDRIVAIKVLLATYAKKDPRAKERFKREATIAASLDYPNSLRIFDYGETDEGVFYIVMEFVQGKDLGKTLEAEGRLPIPRAVHIVRQVLHALMEAHARGIVHRDIKPDNIMLTQLAYDSDFVKVMDFGIAKMVDSGEHLTQAGITLGTPRYMPIEQLKGERLGPATDLYAVGLVLYEMLVGRPAFSAGTAVDTAVLVMRGDPVQVPLDADVPPALRAIIEKASAKNSEDRYQNARAFLDALNALDPALLDGDAADRERFVAEGTSARRPTTAELRLDLERQGVAKRSSKDFEDEIKTQAVSTEDILNAKPPRSALSVEERQAATGSFSASEIAAAIGGAAARRADAQAMETTAVPSALETTAVPSLVLSGARPPEPRRDPILLALLAVNGLVLIAVVVILARVI